ncbi:MAG: hypothetical protein A2W90_19045 [Bacteroidetes bacterium GWF2_42_66]|nr:MAG: hypothetical protein A2W92_05855 [Bacteroidetes bacterium GWA2_42_15]OFX98734.1 MAG: hypothetical protein A2W89_10650 [Bacteroidetes bacterium GWE2_42_39]OFY43069.1 MAG: hypothetical protein A2W90_19045 [Bacteroidetes bacterium GWF2_42_66]HBL77088.1 SusC/RagA family TonB-linked outer membrane protein [Prolixibacteraceae bacterium]HCU59858.1 SusC/RagA family TonB-linked outer membrane protein [Prolixibacteraceae bacterium]
MKKKRMYGILPVKGCIRKLLRIMRLSLFLICWSLIQVSASTYSQNTRLDVKLENASIKELFKDIKAQSEFTFVYNVDDVEKLDVLTCSFSQSTVEEILNYCLSGTDMTYVVRDKVIIISPKEKLQLNPDKPNVTEQPREKQLKGTVFDTSGAPLPGAAVMVKGTTIGTITNGNGEFALNVPIDSKLLVFSFVGYKTQEIAIGNKAAFHIVLEEQAIGLEEVVTVGYGTQKKASVVGAISTTTSKELSRTGGVTNLAMALTGNLPGLTTIQVTGQPGKDDPLIYIRGQGTWNGGQPLILVDGVERKMNDLDMSEVDNISVLKDASATAVYGVKGANGVILITTKRGAKGKPQLTVSANSTVRWPSRLVDKLDAYDTYMVKNSAIEREVPLLESMWADYTPLSIAWRYRNQQSLKWPEAYPNVDWQKETIKDFTMDHRVNMNVSGGTDFARYFSSLAYSTQGDLMKIRDNGRGYKPGFGHDKFNFRTNLDLNLTKTTFLKLKMAGVFSNLKSPTSGSLEFYLNGQYALPPNAFLPQYADGRWGKSLSTNSRMSNSAAYLATRGYVLTIGTDLTSDIGIDQKLDRITKGLSASVNLSFDNHFESIKSISDNIDVPTKYIDPAIEDMPTGGDPNQYITLLPVTGTNQFAWVYKPWTLNDENADNSLSRLRRRLYYHAQLNYARTFGRHDVTATGVFTREQLATGSEFQRYREDWVARTTYNYDNRYFAEFNGAYNGSEKFGPARRFAFFPSGAVGWTISNEKFMNSMEGWLDKLKVRFSYGKIGDDGGLSQRWIYQTQWAHGDQMPLFQYAPTSAAQRSPYTIYREATVGNADIHWETAVKSNLGLEVAVLKNTLSGNFEFFTEDRTGILLAGVSRVLPPYFGINAPTANVGRVTKKGYEFELRLNKNLKDWHLWANASMTHAVDKVVEKEEPELKDPHLLAKGFQIDQTKSVISTGFMQTWDDVYANAPSSSNDAQKLPGNYFLIDFDANGILDPNFDTAPYGYSNRPQNNYNLSLGADYKGWSVMVQFYGVNNVTRSVSFQNFNTNFDIAYEQTLDHWSKENPDASYFLPRWKTSGQSNAQAFLYDGSYLRLKTAEVAYTFTGERLKHYSISSLKLYLNGNNLFFWSKLPDDREQPNDYLNDMFYGAYPTSRRINLGIDIKF